MLAPRGTEIAAVEDEQALAQGEGDDAADGQIPLRASLEASAIGLSVVVDGSADSITATATWGEYEKEAGVLLEATTSRHRSSIVTPILTKRPRRSRSRSINGFATLER